MRTPQKEKEKYLKEKSQIKFLSREQQDNFRGLLISKVRQLQEKKQFPFPWSLPPKNVVKGDHLDLPSSDQVNVYYPNHVLAISGETLSKQREGAWKYYYPSGQILAKGIYINGEKNGPWEIFYANGNLKAKGDYREDLKEGKWTIYSESMGEQTVTFSRGKKV